MTKINRKPLLLLGLLVGELKPQVTMMENSENLHLIFFFSQKKILPATEAVTGFIPVS